MFHTQVQVVGNEDATDSSPCAVFELITPILRGKYPAITEEEQQISVQLQLLCLALLDAVFLHILNTVGPSTWEGIRRGLCDTLIAGKAPRVCRIIADSYADCDVFFIQEAAAAFVTDARKHSALQEQYILLAPQVSPPAPSPGPAASRPSRWPAGRPLESESVRADPPPSRGAAQVRAPLCQNAVAGTTVPVVPEIGRGAREHGVSGHV